MQALPIINDQDDQYRNGWSTKSKILSNQKKKSSLASKENKFQSTEWAKQWKWQWGWYIEFHWNGIGKELRGKRKKKLNIWRNILLEYILGFIIYLIVEKEKKKRGGKWELSFI